MVRIKLRLPTKLPFETTMVVRVTDVNFAGHLGNDAVLSLVHEARRRFLAELNATELDVDGVGTIMVDAAVVYKSEAFAGDVLRVQVGVGDFGQFGCDFFYKLSNQKSGREVARAKTGLVFFDYARRKMVAAPPTFVERCRSYSGNRGML